MMKMMVKKLMVMKGLSVGCGDHYDSDGGDKDAPHGEKIVI